jgi:hypothetical protein
MYTITIISLIIVDKPPNGFELSGRGTPDRYLFYPLLSYNFASKSRSIPGPFQRMVSEPYVFKSPGVN